MKNQIPLAIAYDFDGTLAPGNMQECNFIPAINKTKNAFWKEVGEKSKDHGADNILMYMQLMLHEASIAKVQVHKNNFISFGRGLKFFDGILPDRQGAPPTKGWFDRLNAFGQSSGVDVQHFIVSSGIREMVAGTPIASKFKAIYASSFCYDHNGIAVWPAQALNYTSKTQYLFRINKGCLDVTDKNINTFMPDEERPIPFSNMVYIGDGDTDIPCFRLVKDRGGHSIAVFPPHTRGAKNKAYQLLQDHRINFIAPADYREGHLLDQIIKALIEKLAVDAYVNGLKPPKVDSPKPPLKKTTRRPKAAPQKPHGTVRNPPPRAAKSTSGAKPAQDAIVAPANNPPPPLTPPGQIHIHGTA